MVIAQTVQIITEHTAKQGMGLAITGIAIYGAAMLVYALVIYLLCRHASK